MLICLDIGNSQIYGGVFDKNTLRLRFRHKTDTENSADQLGVFLKTTLRENDIVPEAVKKIAICSVVPSADFSVRAACKKYFNLDPFFLETGAKTGIKIKTKNPAETGSDLIASAIGAVEKYPDNHIIVGDFGTVTTYTFINKNKEFLGATFLPGFRLSMNVLGKAEKLFSVEIVKPQSIMGRSTMECIQSGLYYQQLSVLREVLSRASSEVFQGEKFFVIGTGGLAYLLTEESLFDVVDSDLILNGLKIAWEKNHAPV